MKNKGYKKRISHELSTSLRHLVKALSQIKPTDLKPFNGVFKVEGSKKELKLPAGAIMADLENLAKKSRKTTKQ